MPHLLDEGMPETDCCFGLPSEKDSLPPLGNRVRRCEPAWTVCLFCQMTGQVVHWNRVEGKTMNRVAPHGMASRDSQTAGLCCRLKPAAHAARLAVNRMLPHVLRRPTMTRYAPFIAIVLPSLLAVQTARPQGQLWTGEMALHTRPQKEIN